MMLTGQSHLNLPDKVLAVRTECGLLEESCDEAMILHIEDVLLLEGSLTQARLHFILAHGLALCSLALALLVAIVIAVLRHFVHDAVVVVVALAVVVARFTSLMGCSARLYADYSTFNLTFFTLFVVLLLFFAFDFNVFLFFL